MSAKFIYKMSDENPDLRKQIGCMNGLFQLFERHHFLGGSRRVNGHNHKRLPPARNGNQQAEDKNAPPKTIEKNHKKTVKEKQRNSTESSRTSFSSSSCSSSFASVECSKTCQLEAPSSGQTTAPETQAWEASILRSPASLSSCQSLDLRDVVKDSIYRESHGLSIRTPTKGGAYGQTLNYVDSPRPMQSPKSVTSRNPGIKESFQVLHKLKESPHKSSERNDTLTSAVKDARRFSCDGRESRAALKSTNRLKELPRLSLDSKAGSMRGSAKMKSSSILQESMVGIGNRKNCLNQQEELGSCKRVSSVVARLMGLEALPDSMSTNGNETVQFDAPSHGSIDAYVGLSRTVHENKQKQFSSSLIYQQKEPTSPCPTNAFSTRRPTASSKFPMEPAPRKQLDGNRSSPTAASKNMVTAIKPSNSLSVYGEIDKRLAQLEFKRSGKDLRALKQILEAMQKTKKVLETRNEASNYATQTSSSSSLDERTKVPGLQSTQNNSPVSTLAKGNSSPKSLKSPIVIMKPAKLLGKAEKTASSGNPTESLPGLHRLRTSDSKDGRKEAFNQRNAKDTTPRPNPAIHSGQSPRPTSKSGKSRLPQTSKESKFIGRASEISCESSGTINQKQYQNRLVLEKQHHPGSMPPDSNRARKQSSRPPTLSGSPRGKPRAKSSKLQQSDDELSDLSTGVRDLYQQADAISLQSDSNISFASQTDEEVSSTNRSRKINGPLSQQADWKWKDQPESSSTEKVVAEQPSPVSVLDATFYSEELPSPIKKKSVAFKDDKALIPDDMEWNPTNANYLTRSTNSSVNSMIDHKKEEIIQFLVQNVRHLSSAREGAINHETTPHYDGTNPDHIYISDLLIVSGLLRDFESGFTTIHLHPSGNPIAPNLFTVLEQAKVTTEHLDDHSSKGTTQSGALVTSRRKLIFDVVNEILLHKLISESSSKDTVSPNMLGGKTSQGQQILQELCSEVDRLQGIHSNCCLAEEDDYIQGMIRVDLMHQSSNWTACRSDIPWLVLDVERLIFKDLICEIVADETHGIQSAGHRQQLFSK